MNKKLIIYHAKCMDGFAAAWVAALYFGEENCQLIPVSHGALAPDVTGREVYILDFAFPRNTLIEMSKKAKSIRVIDHHKTAEHDLKDLTFCKFDMNESGASLTWKELIGKTITDITLPKLIAYIRDRDLHINELPSSNQIAQLVKSVPPTLEAWNKLSLDLNNSFSKCVEKGQLLLDNLQLEMEENISNVFKVNIREFKGLAVNQTYRTTTELLNKLLDDNLDVDFTAAFYYNGSNWIYSLRSRNDRADVSEIAKIYNGGGHRNAAGFKTKNLLFVI